MVSLSLAFMAFASWNQSYWWLTVEEDHFGWLTPAFVLFICYERRASLLGAWEDCRVAGSHRVTGFQGIIVNFLMGFMFIAGLLALMAGAADRAAGAHSYKGTFIASFGISMLLLSIPWLTAPASRGPRAGDLYRDPRIALCRLLLFPSFVWLFSEPLLTQTETGLSSYILAPMAEAISRLFGVLGFPILREGNVLLMPDHGRVGIEEACSGIRSFSACLYAGTFLGALLLSRFWQKLLLILLAACFALLLNFFRSVFLTTWAYSHGTSSIEGKVHDSAGYVVMALTVGGLFIILRGLVRPDQQSRLNSAT